MSSLSKIILKDIAFVCLSIALNLLVAGDLFAVENVLESRVGSRYSYIDNNFLSTQKKSNTSSLIITPALRYIRRGEIWDASVRARVKSKAHSDSKLNSNDIAFISNFNFKTERNIYSASVNYIKNTNLNRDVPEFGIAGDKIDKTSLSLGPQYTRLLTERLSMSLNYNETDVTYDDNSVGFVPYDTRTGSISFRYGYSGLTALSMLLRNVDYESKDSLSAYDLTVFQLGITTQVYERLKLSVTLGGSNRTSVSAGNPIDFFGTIITPLGIESTSSGVVANISIAARITAENTLGLLVSRNNVSNSFGGLDQVDALRVTFTDDISDYWRWKLLLGYRKTLSVTTGIGFTDREIKSVNNILTHSLSGNLTVSGSLLFISRGFTNSSTGETPVSSQISFLLSYKFKDLSDF